MDPPDQNVCGTRTIWYTFEAEHSGTIYIQYDNNGTPTFNSNDNYSTPGTGTNSDILLFKQVIPGDSTSSGLVRVPLTRVIRNNPDFPGSLPWGQGCLEPGRYYIMFSGCNNPTATVRPRIWLVPNYGDMCVYPGEININTTNGTFTETLVIDCHGIGESPGEDGTNMQCLGTPVGIKSQWVRVNINVPDTVDIDIELIENTTTTSDQVRYRVATGDCNGMTFDNCVSEGTFIILNLKCRLPGTYWIHSVLPNFATGTIQYKVTVRPSVDTTCTPADPERPEANFTFVADCLDEPVIFTNYSTSGSDMTYHWEFGDGATSTDLNPIYMYTNPGTYVVRLSACRHLDDTTLCDTATRLLSIFRRPTPFFNIPDTVIAGQPITIVNQSTNTLPTSNYLWNFCAYPGFCGANMLNSYVQNPPPLVYSTPGLKAVCLTVYNGICTETYCDTFRVFPSFIYGGGPYDGFAEAAVYPNCLPDIYTGGPYDGTEAETQITTCIENIWVGGPYDGFAEAAV
ncbi:MAG: PKD domain-containing protein, partial [Bacteroidia bacterium]|nr:PKD domain-containing protein [Bacteroidia bacterium]